VGVAERSALQNRLAPGTYPTPQAGKFDAGAQVTLPLVAA
jgi:hypothetical protein